MAKICTPDAASRCKDIIASADGIVLGRGTLGLELPPEKVFVAQKLCLSAANLAGKVRNWVIEQTNANSSHRTCFVCST